MNANGEIKHKVKRMTGHTQNKARKE